MKSGNVDTGVIVEMTKKKWVRSLQRWKRCEEGAENMKKEHEALEKRTRNSFDI